MICIDKRQRFLSALRSGDLNKHEYLINKDLDYKPDSIQKARFEYSPLGQVFNKGLKTDERSECLLKGLKNIEDKTGNQLRAIEDKDKDSGLKSIGYRFKEQLSPEGHIVLNKILKKGRSINYLKLNFTGGNKEEYDFTDFVPIGKFLSRIYNGQILIPAAERRQNAFDSELEKLKKYKPQRTSRYYKLKEDLLVNAQNFYDGREIVIKAFKHKLFTLNDPDLYPHYREDEDSSGGKDSSCGEGPSEIERNGQPTIKEENALEKTSGIENISEPGLVKKYFQSDSLTDLFLETRDLIKIKAQNISQKKLK